MLGANCGGAARVLRVSTRHITSTRDNLSSFMLRTGVRGRVSNCLAIVADAHHGEGQRFIVRGDEKLTPFGELESAIRAFQIDILAVASGILP
jgi:hypothetical protein